MVFSSAGLNLSLRVKIEITLMYLWGQYLEGRSSVPLYCKLSGVSYLEGGTPANKGPIMH